MDYKELVCELKKIDEKDIDNWIDEKCENEANEVLCEENYSGQKIIGVRKGEHIYYLNSVYDSVNLCTEWASQEDISKYGSIVIVVGMANYDYIKEIRKKNRDVYIFVYEPLYSIAKVNEIYIDYEDIKNDDKIVIGCGEEGKQILYETLSNLLSMENLKLFKVFVSPNYYALFEKEVTAVYGIANQCYEYAVATHNTIKLTDRETQENIAKNLIDNIEQYSLESLKEKFKIVDKAKVPAIIVSAGPSLDININDLREAVGKAFIIAVDTAMNPLAKAGIVPDITITVDPHKPLSLFQNESMKNVPMVFGCRSNEKIKEIHNGMRIYERQAPTIVDDYYIKYNKEFVALECGGSVANSACSLAEVLGFKTIIFIGQDLAYPNDKEHSEAAYDGKENRASVVRKDSKFIYVEDIFGNTVKTEPNMNMYRLWFERQVERHPDIKYIDATEGGAKINGMLIKTLKEAIYEECKSEEKIDFGKIIALSKKNFDEVQKKEIYEDLASLKEKTAEIRKLVKNINEEYDKLDKINRKGKYRGKEFERILESINEYSEKLEKRDFLKAYMMADEYEIKDSINAEAKNVYEEFNLFIKNGRKLMKLYESAIMQFENDMIYVVENAKKKI